MEESIKAVVIDDEEYCIANMKYFLSEFCPDIEIVAIGNTIDSARKILQTEKFDVAFMDIELLNDNIFDSLEIVQRDAFKIVFVTAHEKYALRAIKSHAFDYILKPLSRQDVVDCYNRIKQQIRKGETVTASEKEDVEQAHGLERKLIIKDGNHVFIVKPDDIYYLQAKGAYTLAAFRLNNAQKEITISKSLNQVERENNNPKLYRVHKSFLINVHEIKDIIKSKSLSVMMANNKIIPIAKRRAPHFLSFLNKAD